MAGPPDVVVVLGGSAVAGPRPGGLVRPRLVIAADAGLHRADALGLTVDHLVGDLDSVDAARLDAAEAAGVDVHRHPPDKDATDGELALVLAAGLVDGAVGGGRPRLVVIGGAAGRLDLLLADLLLLAGPLTEPFDTTGHVDDATVHVVRPGRPVRIVGAAGEQVSLLPVHGPTSGVTTAGLRWPLVGADLVAATTRGVSNELVDGEAEVAVDTGVLLVVQQGIVAPVAGERPGAYDPSPRA
jgi:thiamine pyrophosphokinase